MTMKRWTAIVLSCVLLASVLVMPTSAASSATITVGTVSGLKGDVVELPVTISAESYLVNADFFVVYDSTRLELVNDHFSEGCYRVGTVFSNNRWIYIGAKVYNGKFRFSTAYSGSIGTSTGGEMFRVAFRILKDDSETIPVNLVVDTACANDGASSPDDSGYPADYELSCTTVAGAVKIGTATEPPTEEKLMGDVTGDGVVNMRDALFLYQCMSRQIEMTDERKEVADMTGDGMVNMRDALFLFSKVSKEM